MVNEKHVYEKKCERCRGQLKKIGFEVNASLIR